MRQAIAKIEFHIDTADLDPSLCVGSRLLKGKVTGKSLPKYVKGHAATGDTEEIDAFQSESNLIIADQDRFVDRQPGLIEFQLKGAVQTNARNIETDIC